MRHALALALALTLAHASSQAQAAATAQTGPPGALRVDKAKLDAYRGAVGRVPGRKTAREDRAKAAKAVSCSAGACLDTRAYASPTGWIELGARTGSESAAVEDQQTNLRATLEAELDRSNTKATREFTEAEAKVRGGKKLARAVGMSARPKAPEAEVWGPKQDESLTSRGWDVRDRLRRVQTQVTGLAGQAQRAGLGSAQLSIYQRNVIQQIRALKARADAAATAAEQENIFDEVDALEAELHGQITAGLVAGRPAFEQHLASAKPAALLEEAIGLIQDVQDLSSGSQIRSEQTYEEHSQGGTSVSASSSSGAAAYGRRSGAAAGSSGSSSASTWHKTDATGRTLLLGAEELSLRVKPHTEGGTAGLTPIAARLVLEKVRRAQEIYRTLARRAPETAAPLQTWMEHTSVAVTVPTTFDKTTKVLQVRRFVPGMLALEPHGVIDAATARTLRADLDARMTGDR